MTRPLLLALALVAAAVFVGQWLAGQPSEADAQADVAASVLDAQADARKAARMERAQEAMQRQQPRVLTVTLGVRS